MREGWRKDDYLILFEESEIDAANVRYAISQFLPGYEIVGLWFWDDFVVRDSSGRTYTVPTVAPLSRYLEPFAPPQSNEPLETDVRFEGKVKWYVKPVMFSGSPTDEANVTWVDHATHAELVRWWNNVYLNSTCSPQAR